MLLRIGIFAALGGFLYGYDLGLIGGALFSIRDEFHLSKAAEEWVVGSAKLGAFFGTFLGGAMMLHYGRRKTIAIDSLFYMAGPLVMAASYNFTLLCFGRFLVGLGIGISAVVVPVYLAEVAPAQVRGRLVLLYELLLCSGMLGSVLADVALMKLPDNWRWMVGVPVLPAAVLAAALFILPESPRWLVVNGHLDLALAVIHRVFTRSTLPTGVHHSTAEVEHELMDLWNAVEKDKVVQAARRAAAARNKTRMEPAQAPLKKEQSDADASKGMQHQASASQGHAMRAVGTRAEWQGPSDEDPVSPVSSCGSALDPQLYRSLSEVPKGLRPIRTSSGCVTGTASDDDNQLKGFGARLRWARQQCLKQSGNQHAAEPTPARNEQLGFWNTLWVMLLDIYVVLTGPEKRAVRIALWLAFFDQGCASTAIINYAPEVLEMAGIGDYTDATLWSSAITAAKIVGVALSVWLIDTAGRRPLLIGGGSVAAVAMVLLTVADYLVKPVLVVMAMCLFIAAFSLSFAGVFWVLVSEIFSMSSKSPAASAATAMLFLAGAVANLVFLSLHQWLGSFSFLVFGAVAGAGAVYSYLNVPETRGKTLAEIQAMLGSDTQAAGIIEVLPRVAPNSDGVRRSSTDAQDLAHQHEHAHSRMESGLLSNSNPDTSTQLHPARTEVPQTTDAHLSFRDRIRLNWFNWSGYQRYQADPTVSA